MVKELCSLESVCARAKASELFTTLQQLLSLQRSAVQLDSLSKNSSRRLAHYIRWLQKDIHVLLMDPAAKVLSLSSLQPKI